MRIRQVVVGARDLEGTSERLESVLGLRDPFRDPGVATFGLRNVVYRIGSDFLEVIAPEQERTALERFLDAREADVAPYMILVDLEDRPDLLERIDASPVRKVWAADLPEISGRHLHPKDLGGLLLSVDLPRPAGSWAWGGPDCVGPIDAEATIAGVTLGVADPGGVAQRWADVLEAPLAGDSSAPEIAFRTNHVRFTPAEAGREGATYRLRVPDPAGVLERASAVGWERDGAIVADAVRIEVAPVGP